MDSKEKIFRQIGVIILEILITGLILMIASKIFRGLYIRNFGFAILASVLLILLNNTIRPFLNYVMLPLNVFTLGFFTPLIDVIILKIIGFIMKYNFVVNGWFSPFFVAIFITIMTSIFDAITGKRWI